MLVSLEDVVGKRFDYIIAGGGTCGLVVAARLSEDPNVSVLVLEAGDANIDDPLLLTPATYGWQFGKEQYDWSHRTTEQGMVSDRALPWVRGKGLGGSSGINFMAWHKPPKEEINDFERLGSPGWNWENYQKYLRKAERFVEPSPESKGRYDLSNHESDLGRDGVIVLSYPNTISELSPLITETFKNAGFPKAPRPYGGDPNGYYTSIVSQDPETATRSYAVTGYYLPNKDRKNLQVVTRALVGRVHLEIDSDSQLLRASGVEFMHDQQTYVIYAAKEVIICAGALKSPQILELSGIGRAEVLHKAGVELKVDLPGVGENLQEHYLASFVFKLRKECEFLTADCLFDPEGSAVHTELYKKYKTGAFATGLIDFAFAPFEAISPKAGEIYQRAKAAIEKLDCKTIPPGLIEQYKIQLERLEPGSSQAGPGCEILAMTNYFGGAGEKGRRYVTFSPVINHSFSRGTVHIISNDPSVDPEMNPGYFKQEIDRDIFLEHVKYVRRLPLEFAPMKDWIECEVLPGPDVKTDEDLLASVYKLYNSAYHTCATCSMLPRENNGVVDPTLRVYGTMNLRVADLSIVPLQYAAHSQATAYAIAEQGADFIRHATAT